jgi:hypothetical protein
MWFATTPAGLFSSAVALVAAERPETVILMPSGISVNLTLSFGCCRAKPKTSKPGPKLAVVAGALTVTWLSGIIPSLNQQKV